MNWFVFWIAVYLLVLIYFTIKHVKNLDIDTYLVNNRNTSTLPLVFTTLATFVGGGVCMGLIAMGYTSGFAAIAIGIAYIIGFFILYFFAAKIRKVGAERNIYSFTEFLCRSYIKNHKLSWFSRSFSGIISGINVVIFFFLTAAQFVGMATILHYAFNVGFVYAAGISFVIVIVYTALAGLSGVIITDFIQFIVIVLMIIVIFIPGIWAETDGLSKLQQLPASFLNGTHEGWLFLLGLPILLSPSVLTRMDIWQRTLAAKSEKTAKRTAVYSGLAMLPFYIIFPLVGMAVRASYGADIDPNNTANIFLENNSGQVLLAFAVIGLLAALMSSADSFLNIVAITAVRGFSKNTYSKDSNKAQFLKIRIGVVVFGAIALALALYFADIVELFIAGITLNILFTPVSILALVKKDVYKYKYAAYASIATGTIVIAAFFTYGFITLHDGILKIAFIPATIMATIALLIGMWYQNRKKSKQQLLESSNL
ncbi:MAG: sodium:solute symporter family protein [Bacteroidales bacterium]